MTPVVEAVTSWPAFAVVAVIFASFALIALVAFKFGGKFKLRIFGGLFHIEHDGKPDDQSGPNV